MATELGRFISDFLEEHPEHPDRGFLEIKAKETTNYLLTRDPEIGNEEVATAKGKIQDLVDINIENRGPLVHSVILYQTQNN